MKKLAIMFTALAALLAPSGAAAANVKQTGYIVGDKAAKVKLRVKVTDGDAVKVAGFRAQNVSARCDKDAIRITLTVHTAIEIERDGDFKARIGDGQGGMVRIAGHVKNHGRATTGTVKTNEFQQGGRSCKVPKLKFKTSSGG